jgi:hypothetical protein
MVGSCILCLSGWKKQTINIIYISNSLKQDELGKIVREAMGRRYTPWEGAGWCGSACAVVFREKSEKQKSLLAINSIWITLSMYDFRDDLPRFSHDPFFHFSLP